MQAVDTSVERGARRRGKRALSIAALAAAALVVAGSGACLLALRAMRVRGAVRAIHDAGGVVTWDYELEVLVFDRTLPPEERQAILHGRPAADLDRDGRAWLRRLLGPEWLNDVAAVKFPHSGEENGALPFQTAMEHLVVFPRLRRLFLLDAQATDRTLEIAGGLRELESLIVHGVSLSDEGLRHLRRLSRLQNLAVWSPLITDAGVRHLTVLDKLESLALRGTQVTDRGTTALLELKSLRSLNLDGKQITENGIEMLRAMLPGVQVSR